MKKAFTLIEVVISIVLLMIIVVFLYQSLDITEKSNKFFKQKLVEKIDTNDLKKIFFKDIVYSYKSNSLKDDNNKNTIFSLETSNTYHNAFYENITYFVSKKNNLIRIESKDLFDKNKLNDEFFDNVYIDIIALDIKKFKVLKKENNQYAVYLKFNDNRDTMFIVKSMR